jgi:hypothetical protein
MGITTIDELKQWYNTYTELPENMGKRTITEIEELLASDENGMYRYELLNKLKEERKLNQMKTLIKNLHKEAFYMGELNIEKLYKLNLELNNNLKNFNKTLTF